MGPLHETTTTVGKDTYVSNDNGGIYTTRDRADQAGQALLPLIKEVQDATQSKSISATDLMTIVKGWEDIGNLLRTPTYHENSRTIFALHLKVTSSDPAKAYLAALRRLVTALDSDGATKILAFVAAEAAYTNLIWSTRAGFNKKDTEAFNDFLERWTHLSTSQIQAGPG